ncbi:MAG: dockerin type I repeat-containing protein [Planctomycetota bacterium]
MDGAGRHRIFSQIYFITMECKLQKNPIYWLFIAILLFCKAGAVWGVILHPAGEPNLAEWTDRPYDYAIGRWGINCSCVAVSRNCVISVRHSGSSAVDVVFDSATGETTYTPEQVWNHPVADLRLAKLANANLAHFVDLYADSNEVGQEAVIGGYGLGRGAILQTSGITYGYEWAGSGNTTLRWGTNIVESTIEDSNNGGWISDVVTGDFDGLGEGNSTDYEAMVANYDSGGGLFLKSGNTWQVAGLFRSVNRAWESWFRNRDFPEVPMPDDFDAVRISSYHQWLSDRIPAVLPGDLNGDDYVDFTDFAAFAKYYLHTDCQEPDWCLGADCEPDGDVDLDDLAFLLEEWLNGP